MTVSTFAAVQDLINEIFEDVLFVARETNLMTNLVFNYNARGWMNRNRWPSAEASMPELLRRLAAR